MPIRNQIIRKARKKSDLQVASPLSITVAKFRNSKNLYLVRQEQISTLRKLTSLRRTV
jgi:hypothetical protein